MLRLFDPPTRHPPLGLRGMVDRIGRTRGYLRTDLLALQSVDRITKVLDHLPQLPVLGAQLLDQIHQPLDHLPQVWVGNLVKLEVVKHQHVLHSATFG